MTLALLAAALLLACAGPASGAPLAGGGTPDSGPAAPSPAAPSPAEDLGPPTPETPRGAVIAYLRDARRGDYEAAARHLDLRRIPEGERPASGARLARDLKIVLDRTLWVDVADLSQSPEGDLGDGLRPGVDRVGTLRVSGTPVDVLLERVPGEAGTLVWKFAGRTVAQIPALYAEFGYGPLYDVLPEWLVVVRVLEVALWQWIGLALLVSVSWLLSGILRSGLVRLARPFVARSATSLDDQGLAALGGPLRLWVAIGIVRSGLLALGLAVPVHDFLTTVITAVAIVAGAWALFRVTDVVAGDMAVKLLMRGKASAASIMPMVRRGAKVVVGVLAAVMMLDNLGLNVTALLAGLGVGGLAVALAAQKTVENLFGGLTLVMDQPVRVGDFCRFGTTVGTIEDIGLRSTRVRTLERTIVTVPNADFSSMQLENFARRDRIWLKGVIGLRYETTPDQLRYVLVEVRRMLYGHPRVVNDGPRIRFIGFGAHSLDLEIFAYVDTTDFGEFMAIREDIYLRVMDIVAAAGTSVALPSQRVFLGRDGGLDGERTRAAEAQVASWRAERRLPLPEFPAEEVAELAGSLRYPVDGAAARSAS